MKKVIVSRKLNDLQPCECLMKRIVWKQLGDIRDKKILDLAVVLGFEHAHSLLDGNDGMTSKYGAIRYYEDFMLKNGVLNW